MSKPVDAFINGAAGALGAAAMTQVVIPAGVKVAQKTAELSKGIVQTRGTAMAGAATAGTIGGAIGGPVGAVAGAALGYATGAEEDERLYKKYKETGEDERCLVQ